MLSKINNRYFRGDSDKTFVGQGVRSLPGWEMSVYWYLIDGLLIDRGDLMILSNLG